MRPTLLSLTLALLAPGSALSCAPPPGSGDASAASGYLHCVRPPQYQLEEELRKWREERLKRLTAPHGWLSLVGLHWLEGAGPWRLGRESGDLVLGVGPEALGILWSETEPDGTRAFHLVTGEGRFRLATDARGEPAGHAEFEGGLRLAVIRRGERHALRVWDPEAPARRHFAGLEHYPPSLRWWLVRARFEPHDPVRELEVPDVTGGLQRLRNPGRLRFESDGRSFALEAFQEAPGERLFLVFADRTNGRETYGGGRFLYADPPDAEGTVWLDFNRAFNPPCAFTAFATCPLPPPENRLDLAIEAGEKRYRPREAALSGP